MNRIKYIRITYGETQEQLAEAIGVTQASLSNWERGVHMPGVDDVKRIAAHYNINMEFVSGGDDVDSDFPDDAQAVFWAKIRKDLGREPSEAEVRLLSDTYKCQIKVLRTNKISDN